MTEGAGRLVAIAVRAARRQPMREIPAATVSADSGIEGDFKGAKYPRRQITVLARSDWQRALDDLVDLAGPVPLPWTARRANLLVDDIELPRGRGSMLDIGPLRLEVTGQTYPCRRMEEVHPGLLKALAVDWRGGVTCRILHGGHITVGDRVAVTLRKTERPVRLPG
jgi:MOSC domain-containing protein YiiM